MTSLIYVLFFLSGAAALLFETLWFQQAGLVLGNSIWASSLVMAAFMGGVLPGVFLALMFASPWWRRRMSAAANTPPRKAEFVKIKPNH